MRSIQTQFDVHNIPTQPFGPRPLMTARQVSAAFGVSTAWVYQRTKHDAKDPLPVYRLGGRGIRFNPYRISTYLRSRERHRLDATLIAFDGIARVNGNGLYTLTRKRFQSGSVRLRTDRSPAYWQGFYREDIVTEAGKTVRNALASTLAR
jgi:predicted DNA-binding transcriptional regulator AlpA